MSSNLFKQYYVSVETDNARIIDSNALMQKKLKEIRKKMQESVAENGLAGLEPGFTEGLDATRVAELLEDNPQSRVVEPVNTAPVYEGPSEEEIQQMIEERLQEAKKQAEEILNKARMEADNIMKQAHTEGMKKGHEEGVAKGIAEYQAKENSLLQKEKQLEKEYEAKIDQLEPMFVDTITNVYEKIFHTELTEYADMLVYMVEAVMKQNDEDSQFMVHVSTKDYKKVFAKKAELLERIARDNLRIEVVEDSTISEGQCMIETENGVYDCGIDTQLKELKKQLRQLAYQRN